MKKLTFVLFLFIISVTVEAKEYAVVAAPSFPSISIGKIKAIYLKKISFIGGKKVVAINLGSRDSMRRSFEKKVLKMGFGRLKSYWIKQHYLGHRPPITVKSQKSVRAFLKKVDGAIGYMELDNVDNNLKILYRWSD